MTGCNKCDRQTTRSGLCRQCAIDERYAEPGSSDIPNFECPSCGGQTSGKGVECSNCREVCA